MHHSELQLQYLDLRSLDLLLAKSVANLQKTDECDHLKGSGGRDGFKSSKPWLDRGERNSSSDICTPKRTEDPESGCPNFYEKDKMFVSKRISLFDEKGEAILPYMEEAIRFIGEGEHCHRGISRSASFVIGYLIRHNELTFSEALSHVQSCREIVQPNTSFLQQLQVFAAQVEQDRGRLVLPLTAAAPAEEKRSQAAVGEAGSSSLKKRSIQEISEDYGPAAQPPKDTERTTEKPRNVVASEFLT